MKIKIRELEDGRFAAQYRNGPITEGCKGFKYRDPLHGIEQYGKTAFEAMINLQVLLNELRRQQMKVNITVCLSA